MHMAARKNECLEKVRLPLYKTKICRIWKIGTCSGTLMEVGVIWAVLVNHLHTQLHGEGGFCCKCKHADSNCPGSDIPAFRTGEQPPSSSHHLGANVPPPLMVEFLSRPAGQR
jgi:hypothetical protein